MTEEQEAHLTDIQEAFDMMVSEKYRKGAKEHGGNLTGKSLAWYVEQAIDEAIDSFVYLYTLRQTLLEQEADEDDQEG